MGEQLRREVETTETKEETAVQTLAEQKEKQAAYKRKQAAYHRRIEQIETSNTWKLGNLFKLFQRVWRRFFNRSAETKEQIAQLEQTIVKQQEQIDALQTELIPLQFLDEGLTNFTITQQIRSLKEEGSLLEKITDIVAQKNKLEANYREALLYAARLYMKEDDAIRQEIYEQILSGLAIEQIPEFMIREGLTESPMSLRHAASFRGSLSTRMRQQQLTGTLPEWHLDDKQTAYDFVKQFDITVPQLDASTYTIQTMPIEEGTVLKPIDAAGARGVYLIHGPNHIFDVRHAAVITNENELKEAMQEDLATGAVSEDAWLVEQLIYENKKQLLPARDIKFYSFYGKVGLILEIIRDPEIRHAWWTRDGKRIGTGKYEASLFNGQGVSEEDIVKVERLSSAIPAPFMRIDFLQAESGLVFGEFTPKPGNYDDFDQQTDAWLGDYFVQAEGKLVQDLLNGKTFPEYEQFIRMITAQTEQRKMNV